MRVTDAIAYERARVTTLWSRRVGNGTLTCELLKGHKPSRRLVQLVADYENAGDTETRTCVCDDPLDEARQIKRLETIMLEAAARPSQYDTELGEAIAEHFETGAPLPEFPASPQDQQ